MRILNVWTCFWIIMDAGVILPSVHTYMQGMEMNPLFYWGITLSIYGGLAIFMLETLVESPNLLKFAGFFLVFIGLLHYVV